MRFSEIQPCGCFSRDINEGMRAFCIVEMFIALFHLIVALSRIPVLERWWFEGYYDYEGEDYTYLAEKFWAGFTLLFMITLIAQSILAFLLYFIGWRKKDGFVCVLWMVCAGLNVIWPWILLIFYLTDKEGSGSGWDLYLLYLLYPIFGIWIVIVFMIEGGLGGWPRGIYLFNHGSAPSSATPGPSKPDKQKQDVEG